MSHWIVIAFVAGYFLLLMGISFITGRKSDSQTFFRGNKQSPWYVVAFGMIGASLSGVTFISVPGWVDASQFSYMQMVLGYLVGYAVIGTVLLPLYYKLNLTSIYTYLDQRFGKFSYRTGAFFFLISRTIGAAFRLYLVAAVFQIAVFDKLGVEVNFAFTVVLTILLIWLYTFRSGIKTIIWTDTLQTLFMLLAVGATLILVSEQVGGGLIGLTEQVWESSYSQMFFFDDLNDKRYFWKQFIAGIFIAIVMTGLDQDMMQKNLTCRSLGDAQKNMFWFSIVLVFVNLLFLGLGASLYLFAGQEDIEIPAKVDLLYPMIAIDGHLGLGVGLLFIIGLIAAAYSSADSALTALTTSFCVDFLGIERHPEKKQIRLRKGVHVGFSILLVFVIVAFDQINDDSVISKLFQVAGYTYGPLLGLYAFGLFTKRVIRDRWVLFACFIPPVICYFLATYSTQLLSGYQIGFELLIINGALTFLGLFFISLGNPQRDSAVLDDSLKQSS